MTPKEKAKGLVLKFAFKGAQHEGEAKQFALIAVDEILNQYHIKNAAFEFYEVRNYWQEVKEEINKL